MDTENKNLFEDLFYYNKVIELTLGQKKKYVCLGFPD